jgi:hypothetical protein
LNEIEIKFKNCIFNLKYPFNLNKISYRNDVRRKRERDDFVTYFFKIILNAAGNAASFFIKNLKYVTIYSHWQLLKNLKKCNL